jgi:hypothetical protein
MVSSHVSADTGRSGVELTIFPSKILAYQCFGIDFSQDSKSADGDTYG